MYMFNISHKSYNFFYKKLKKKKTIHKKLEYFFRIAYKYIIFIKIMNLKCRQIFMKILLYDHHIQSMLIIEILSI